MTGRTMYKVWALALVALTLSACDGRALVAGNMFFMGITCAMLWSTINLKKKD
ncbi:hypothetical protein [Persicimonas caeni]|uniref:hypothetical protein n=1 Tax=Persicimonas caeni TaxID=2292766 RepID=UPI00143DCAE8|nr:hypothetical protein [Persicimonas caeni]